MRHILLAAPIAFLVATAAALVAPAAAEAQIPRFMVGGGVSMPIDEFDDDVDLGYHGRVGIQMGALAFPLAGRLEGEYHAFGQTDGAPKVTVLNGTLSAVLELQGTVLSPYFLVGAGRYWIDTDVTEATAEMGFQGGFGVNIGALGFGGFVEARVIQINTEGEKIRYFPVSVGFRL